MDLTTFKVLLIDDDPAMLRLLSIWLKQAGFEVQVAADGLEALQSIERECPDFLITDWGMPRLDGLELCRQMRQFPLPHYVYPLILGGRSSPGDMIAGSKNGADDFLTKPVSEEVLLARLFAGTQLLERERHLNVIQSKSHTTIPRHSATP